jgi:retron-type reverse transcriptase
MVRERVSDRRVVDLVSGWLRAGVLAGEQLLHPQAGTPQGGVTTPPTQ